MHGDKKWIRDYNGRLKRSTDRTHKDFFSDLNRSYRALRQESKDCPDCQLRKEELGYWTSSCWKYFHYNEVIVNFPLYYHVPPDYECEYHRWKERVSWNRFGGRYGRGIPYREHRATVSQMMRRAKYDFELYDHIGNKVRNAVGWW